MKEYTITIKRRVTLEQIQDILESAWPGIAYWADEVKKNGSYYKVHDAEENQWHNLTIKKFLKGLELTPWFDFDNYDMYDADAVVQRALFGKVIYG